MKKKCDAPCCIKDVEVSWMTVFIKSLTSFLRGGSFASFDFCAEHEERVHSDTFDDGDPNTNPDLVEEQMKRKIDQSK